MRKLFLYALWLLVALLLMSVSNYFLNQSVYDKVFSVSAIVLGNFGLIGVGFLIAGWVKSKKSKWMSTLLFTVFFVIIFITLSEILVYKYSGVAFVEQAFLHFELQSLLVGFSIYPLKYTLIVFVIGLISLGLVTLAMPISNPKVWLLAAVCLWLSVSSNYGTSLGRLTTNFQNYIHQKQVALMTAERIKPYAAFGLRPIAVDNQKLKAQFIGKQKNLIIIYLESFSRGFINSEKYPNLTPEIDQLIKTYGELNNYHSTAKFTMQGLMSSLCGVIPKLATGNNISSSQIPYKNLPCLTDVLKLLGYQQEFLGGARKSFSNKEKFLKSKNFDRVYGWLDYAKPKNYQTNDWGLQDSDLLEFALGRVSELESASQPYHLSLLTLATHLNGNPDPSCPEYKPQENHHKFIQGIHCADFLLGQFIQQLKTKDVLDKTTLLITSDHGVFPVELIRELFGKDFDRNQLLGILIDDYAFNQSLPIALYDVPAILINALKIDFNSGFINGRAPEEVSENRFLLRENVLNTNHDFAQGCNEHLEIKAPIDACENQRLVEKTWGYAANFNQELEPIKLDGGVVFTNTKLKNKRRSELILGEASQLEHFLVEGYPLTENERKYRNHIFVLVYDLDSENINSYNAFRFIPTHVDYFNQLILELSQQDSMFFVFTELSIETPALKAWSQSFESLGSEIFNYPAQPYFAIFKNTEGVLSKVEWSSKEGQNLQLDLGDLSQLSFKPVKKQ